MMCSTCGADVPGFLWPLTEPQGSAGGHYVLLEKPVEVRHDAVDYTANTVRIVATMDCRLALCREVHEASARAAQILADRDLSGPFRGLPTAEDLDRAHANVMADAHLLTGEPAEPQREKDR